MAQMTQPVMMFNLLKFIEVSESLKCNDEPREWFFAILPAVNSGGEGNVFGPINTRVWNSWECVFTQPNVFLYRNYVIENQRCRI